MPHGQAEGEPWTFAVDSAGDLVLTDNQTVRIASGEQATVQDLKVALATYRGTDPRDPEFGLNVFNAIGSNQALKREVRKTLEYDDYRHNRVSAVREIEVVPGPGRSAAVHATISLTDMPDDITLVFDLFNMTLDVVGDLE